MPQNWYKHGDWNAICDICGFKFKASQLKKNWKGEMVCEQDWETRHPQELLRVPKDDPSVPWARPQGEDQYIFICWIWGTSAYADLGEADCMKADYAPSTYTELYFMKFPPPPGVPQIVQNTSSIPGYMIPGNAIPSETFTGLTYGLNP